MLQELLYRCLDAAGISRGATYLLEPDGQFSLRARLGYPGQVASPVRAMDIPDYITEGLLDPVLERAAETAAAGEGTPGTIP